MCVVTLEHDVAYLVDRVRDDQQIQILRRDGPTFEQSALDPLKEAFPVAAPVEHDRKPADLAGLHERERLEELVEGPESAWEDDKPIGELHEHRLSDEEIAEVHREVQVSVLRLLERQLDVAADGKPARLLCASVRGLHDSGSAAGDHGETGLRELAPERAGGRVIGRFFGDPSGSENRNACADLSQGVDPLNELALDPEDAPGLGVGKPRELRQPCMRG